MSEPDEVPEDGDVQGVPPERIEVFLARHDRSAASLLAAFHAVCRLTRLDRIQARMDGVRTLIEEAFAAYQRKSQDDAQDDLVSNAERLEVDGEIPAMRWLIERSANRGP